VSGPDAAARPDAGAGSADARPVDALPPDASPPPDARIVPDGPSPVDTVLDSTPADPTNADDATFAFSSAAAGATFECALEAPPVFAPCTSPATFPGLADGPHVFAVRATAHGVTDETPATFAWTVDTTGPTVTLDGPSGGQTTGRTAAFGFTSEAGATFTCALDGADLAPCPGGTKTYTLLAGGAHEFAVRATDALGNAGTIVTADFVVDATGPTVTIVHFASDESGRDGAVGYSADEAATLSCKLDGGGFAACPADAFPFSGLAAGGHTLTAHATDAFGNTGDDASYTWTVTGPISVTVLDGTTPIQFATVVGIGEDLDRAKQVSAVTDANGHASITLKNGGIVEAYIQSLPMQNVALIMIGVQPFESIVLGRGDPGSAEPFSIQRTVPALPSGTTCIENDLAFQATGCVDVTSPKTIQFGNDQLDSTGKANLMTVAGSSSDVLGFGWVPGIAPGAGVAVDVPAWLPPVATPFTLSHLAQSAGVTPVVGMNGILYPVNKAFKSVAATDNTQLSLPMPPASVGDRRAVMLRNISGVVVTDPPGFDGANFLPPASNLVFTPFPITNTSETLTYSLPGATGVVLVESWPGNGVTSTTIVVAPATGEMVIGDFGSHMIPFNGNPVTVTMYGFDLGGASDAEFRHLARGLVRAVSGGGLQPLPDVGAGNVLRESVMQITR